MTTSVLNLAFFSPILDQRQWAPNHIKSCRSAECLLRWSIISNKKDKHLPDNLLDSFSMPVLFVLKFTWPSRMQWMDTWVDLKTSPWQSERQQMNTMMWQLTFTFMAGAILFTLLLALAEKAWRTQSSGSGKHSTQNNGKCSSNSSLFWASFSRKMKWAVLVQPRGLCLGLPSNSLLWGSILGEKDWPGQALATLLACLCPRLCIFRAWPCFCPLLPACPGLCPRLVHLLLGSVCRASASANKLYLSYRSHFWKNGDVDTPVGRRVQETSHTCRHEPQCFVFMLDYFSWHPFWHRYCGDCNPTKCLQELFGAYAGVIFRCLCFPWFRFCLRMLQQNFQPLAVQARTLSLWKAWAETWRQGTSRRRPSSHSNWQLFCYGLATFWQLSTNPPRFAGICDFHLLQVADLGMGVGGPLRQAQEFAT